MLRVCRPQPLLFDIGRVWPAVSFVAHCKREIRNHRRNQVTNRNVTRCVIVREPCRIDNGRGKDDEPEPHFGAGDSLGVPLLTGVPHRGVILRVPAVHAVTAPKLIVD
jgi:hypothetical protein